MEATSNVRTWLRDLRKKLGCHTRAATVSSSFEIRDDEACAPWIKLLETVVDELLIEFDQQNSGSVVLVTDSNIQDPTKPLYVKGLRLKIRQFADMAEYRSLDYSGDYMMDDPIPDAPYGLASFANNTIDRLEVPIIPKETLELVSKLDNIARGNELEDPTRAYVAKRLETLSSSTTSFKLRYDDDCYTYRRYPLLCGKVDGLLTAAGRDVGVLEVKTVHPTRRLFDAGSLCRNRDWLSQNYPEDSKFHITPLSQYWLQVQTYMHLRNLEFAIIAVYVFEGLESHGWFGCIHVPKDTVLFDSVYAGVSRRYFESHLFYQMRFKSEEDPPVKFSIQEELLDRLVDRLHPQPEGNTNFNNSHLAKREILADLDTNLEKVTRSSKPAKPFKAQKVQSPNIPTKSGKSVTKENDFPFSNFL